MIKAKQSLSGYISDKGSLTGTLSNALVNVYPELEDIVVAPMPEEQNLTSTAYGFRNITVKAGSDSSNATATSEDIIEGKTAHVNNQEVVGTYVSPYNAIAIDPTSSSFEMINCIQELPELDMSKVTSLSEGFYYAEKLKTIKGLKNMSNVTNMYRAFCRCYALVNFPDELDTSKVTNMEEIFYYCRNLKKIPKMNLLNVTNAKYMFYYCQSLEGKVELTFGDKVTDTRYIFDTCKKITEATIDMGGSATKMNGFFSSCEKLTSVELKNTQNVTDMSGIFNGCRELTTINEFDTSNVTNMSNMFYPGYKIDNIPMMNAGKCINIKNVFYCCNALKNFGGFKDYGKAFTQKTENYSNYQLNISDPYHLTVESVIATLNLLYDLNLTYDVANGGTLYRQKVYIGSSLWTKLKATEEGLQAMANAEAKGWNVAY